MEPSIPPPAPPPRIKIRIRRGRWGKRALIAGAVLAVALTAFVLWTLQPFWELSAQFTDIPSRQPSRLYGRSLAIAVGELADEQGLLDELERLSYRPAEGGGALQQGRFRRTARGFEVFLRSSPAAEGLEKGYLLGIELSAARVARLTSNGQEVASARLEAPLLATYYGPEVEERRPVVVYELPDHVLQAVLAAEDERFFKHSGVSVKGILRAVWVNLRGGELRQGGSTLTQQLVKNLYLSHERSVGRKVQEGVLSLFLEARYSKAQILQAYLNEIYLGTLGGVNLQGIGAASRAYFGKDPEQLSVGEAATLAGIIPAPGSFSPVAHREKALERRNLVLSRLAALGTVPAEAIEVARREPLAVAPVPPVRRRAPYFGDAMAEEAARRFGVKDLAASGYTLLSTLSLGDQKAAEDATSWGLASLEKGWEKGSKAEGPLQVALVSIDPRTGAILSYLGGRDYGASQFDRVVQARRQAGSAFKAVVYAAAFESGTVTPATLVEDAPLTVTEGGQTWTPLNDDKEFAGWVTVRRAVEKSLNIPTARVALATGLPKIVSLAKKMGVTAPLQPFPSLSLGAFELTPLELATVYGTLAGGGVRPPAHGLEAVLDKAGEAVPGTPLPAPERVLSKDSAYLVTSILQGVVNQGTGASVRSQGLFDPLAGKTGTTNGRRDSWFAGYSPDRTTVVWLGYDDNAKTRLSGSRAAAPIWGRFTLGVRPPGGYRNFGTPGGIVVASVDPTTGGLATTDCPEAVNEVFREGTVPTALCAVHDGFFAVPAAQGSGVEGGERRPLRSWLRRVFGGKQQKEPPGGTETEPDTR